MSELLITIEGGTTTAREKIRKILYEDVTHFSGFVSEIETASKLIICIRDKDYEM